MSNSSTICVDICIATYKRPEMLQRTVESIISQQQLDNISINIIIVDNDSKSSARLIVSKIKESHPMVAINYVVEPEQNISLVRNKALSLAKGDFHIFIDDDEWASPNWLINLLNTQKLSGVEIVAGPVLPSYPLNTPDWIKRGHFFERERHVTGTELKLTFTGNVLITRDALTDLDELFVPSYGLTGGGDAEFFNRLVQQGKKIVWCDEAYVHEEVLSNRMSVKWLLLRAFRGGQTWPRIFISNKSFLGKTVWFVQRIIYLCIALLSTPLGYLGGKAYGVRALQKVATNTGQILSIFSWKYQEYKD